MPNMLLISAESDTCVSQPCSALHALITAVGAMAVASQIHKAQTVHQHSKHFHPYSECTPLPQPAVQNLLPDRLPDGLQLAVLLANA